MVFGGIVASPRSSLSAVQSLRLAKAYLECATKEQDMDVTLVLCHDTEVSLSQAKRSAKSNNHQMLHPEIAKAYTDLGDLLHNRGCLSEAKASYNKAEKYGIQVKDPGQHTDYSRSNSIDNTAAVITPVPIPTVIQQIQRRDTTTVPPNINFENVRPPSLEFKLPEPDEHLINTPQLAGCLGILQATRSPGDILDPDVRRWLQSIEKDEDEQDRLKVMATDIIRAFKRDKLKDAKAIAEIVYLAPVLDKDAFRDLLDTFYVGIDQSGLLDFHQLDGIAYLIQGADNGHLEADDLVKILGLLRTRLTETHRQSPEHIYRLTITVSHVLDAMADTKVKDVDRVDLHEPLKAYLSGLQGSSDPYMVYQAAYAFQALLCVPDDETPWQAAMRRTGKIVRGVSGLASAVNGLDLNKLIDGLGDIQQGFAGASEIVGIVKTAYEGFASFTESGHTFMECLKEGLSFERKRAWYSVLRGADALIQDGELSTFKELVFQAPCRHDLAFQWGVCQRLGEIASNPMWSANSRQGAVALLGEMYRNDAMWGQHAPVKQLIINILMQVASSSSGGGLQLHATAAVALLGEFELDQDVNKRALFQACRTKEPTTYLLRVALPGLGTPSLIDRVQRRPDVESSIRLLRRRRLKEDDNAVYIPPQAKADLQSSYNSRFPLMEKVKEFLDSNRKVFLLTGDSGAGKSTFTRQLEIELWQTYIKGGRIPLHVNLPAIDKPEHDMIAKQLRKFGFTEPQIRELKTHRRFILICDGYDESQQIHNLYTRNQLNQVGEWGAQMVISCRSEYLGANYQDRFQPGDRNKMSDSSLFQEAVLTPFSSDQIQAYIKQYVTVHQPLWQAEDYMQALESIPSLMDLTKNPFLMALSLDVLPRMVDPGQQTPASRITRVALYDQFIEQWLERGKKRISEKDMSRQSRAIFENLNEEGFTNNGIDFIKRFAVAIYKEQDGQPVVQYSRFLDEGSWKDAFFTREDRQMIREACPLKRNGNQHWFIHRSLLEYGLALAIYDPRAHGGRTTTEPPANRRGSVSSALSFDLREVDDGPISTEQEPDINSPLAWRDFVKDTSLLQFLEERVQQDPVFKQQLHAYIEHSKKDKKWRTAAANSITLLVRAGVQFNNADLRGVQIPRADLSYGVFGRAQLQGADLRKANLRGVWIQDADLTGAYMTGVRFGELPFIRVFNVIRLCAYSPDGSKVAIALDNSFIDLHSTDDWEYAGTLVGHDDIVWSIAFSSNGKHLASGGRDTSVRLWSLETKSCDKVLSGHTMDVKCVAFSPQGQHLASASYDGTIRIWDVSTGECLRTLSEDVGELYCVVYSPDGSRIASSGDDYNVRLWSPDTGDCTNVLTGHSNSIDCVAYSPQGSQVASASDDMTIRLWDVDTGKCLRILGDHNDSVNRVAYSPNGSRVVSGSLDYTVRLWDVESGVCLQVLTGHTDSVLTVAFSPKGNQVASGGWDYTLRFWDIDNGRSRSNPAVHSAFVEAVKFSPAGSHIVSGSGDTTVRLWDLKSGACSQTLRGHTGTVFGVDYSPQGNRVVSCSYDKTARLWDLESGLCRLVLSGHMDEVHGVAFSPLGDIVASVSYDATVRVWDALTGECRMILIGHTNRVFGVTFSPNGKLIATCSMDKTIRLWDVGTGACSQTLEGHSDWVYGTSFSRGGHQLASVGSDIVVRQWDVETGSCDAIMIGHTNGGKCVAYSPNDRLLASAGWDWTVRIWDTSSGRCQAVIGGFMDVVYGIDWSTDKDTFNLITGCGDGSVNMWSVAEDGEACDVRLRWMSTSGALSVRGACIQGVHGLSQFNKTLLKQRRAVGEPIDHLREVGQEVTGMASKVSRVKQPWKETEVAPSSAVNLPNIVIEAEPELPGQQISQEEERVEQKQAESPIVPEHEAEQVEPKTDTTEEMIEKSVRFKDQVDQPVLLQF